MNRLMSFPLRGILAATFGVVLFVIASMTYNAMTDVRDLAAITERLFKYPYAVAANVRDIQIDVVRMNRAARDVLLATSEADVNTSKATIAKADSEAGEALKALRMAYLGDKADLDAVEKAFLDWRPLREKLLSMNRTDASAGMADFQRTMIQPLVRRLEQQLDEIESASDKRANEFFQHAMTERDAAMRELFAISSAVFLIAALAGFMVSYLIRTPLNALREAMVSLAGGNLKTEVPHLTFGNEIGAMAKAVLVFKENGIERERLQADAARDQESRARRQAALEQAITGFEASASTVMTTIASAANELQASAESMSSAAEETSLQSTAVASAAVQASTNVQGVAAAGEELAASIGEILRQARESGTIAGKAVTDAGATDAKVQELAAAAEKIGAVVGLINGIAAQTNLLALNATIEAARAGEAGKGFAVVASEVKELANQTTRATSEIAATITSIQSVTGDAIEAIQGIAHTIAEIDRIAGAITSSMEEQGRATAEIAMNVQQAARGTDEVSSAITHVTGAATTTGTASAQVLGAASELSRQSEVLRTEMDRFLASARAA